MLSTGVLILLALPVNARAERLPVRSYTTADGLAHDRVQQIVRDSRGFLWFCTVGGLSRFDGRRFVSYSTADGLPVHTLYDLLENKDGSYWLATNGAGVVRYDPEPARDGPRVRFTRFSVDAAEAANRVNVLYRDKQGRLWVGTDGGLFVAERERPDPVFRAISLQVASFPDSLLQIWSLADDGDGTLWIGSSAGLIRRRAHGQSHHYRMRDGTDRDNVRTVILDSDRKLWIGFDGGLVVAPVDVFDRWSEERDALLSAMPQGLKGTLIQSLLRASDGRVWVGTFGGLHELVDGRVRTYGLEGASVSTLEEDAHGNIWAGTEAEGAARVARDGLTTYNVDDGLDHALIRTIFETRAGQLCAISRGPRINVFDGQRFHAVAPKRRGTAAETRSPTYAVAIHDRAGEWWVPFGDALFRFPAVANPASLATTPPSAVYEMPASPASRGIWRIFEDSRGDIWIGRRAPAREVIARLERASGTLRHYSAVDGLAPNVAQTFAEDRAGNIWIGFWGNAGLARYRHGRFEMILTEGGVATLHVDRSRRLWCGTNDGLLRIDDPDADRLQVVRYSTKDGLADDVVRTIVEDESGRLYIGTRHGIDRFDPESRSVRHFTTEDGLAALETVTAYRDRQGALWFSTPRGLSKLVPRLDPGPAPSAPAALLSSVRLDGLAQPISDLGLPEVNGTPLAAGGRLEVEFFALSLRAGETVKYQYRLDGIDDWSTPTDQRSVTYPRLSPGSYRFLVRAVRGGDTTAGPPALLTVTVLPPMWARWWFVSAVALTIVLAGRQVYRYRVGRLLEIERIRTRLAMDLHDDIGSTLSQVAVLSEVARQRAAGDRRQLDLLERIAEISRELIDAMSDVVWAINPERDSLAELVQRMRRFAAESLDNAKIDVRFDGPAPGLDIRVGSDVRREVFLIFKEGINNLRRYANCTSAVIGVRLRGSSLELTIEDDGVGLDAGAPSEGLGLRSMRRRAERLGAELHLRSAPGAGTAMSLVVPLKGS